jgi:putative NADH-flavin reductase
MGCNNTKQNGENCHKSKRIFLIGGTGRTGLLVAEEAIAEGHTVTAIVKSEPKVPGTL